jgi:hypothetical protein
MLFTLAQNHNSWFSAQDNYRITAFTNGNADINGLYLNLDHIKDSTLRPLDSLFVDHFIQGLSKHMKGAGTSAGFKDTCGGKDSDSSGLSCSRL